MNKIKLFSALLYTGLHSAALFVHAASPLFSFTPLTPTRMAIPSNATATVQYTVTNNSLKAHTLALNPLPGIQQITSNTSCSTPLILAGKQSCTLILHISGKQMPALLTGGPKLCQVASDGNPNPLLCYQPSKANSLHLTTATAQQPTLFAASQNGMVYYSLNDGTTWKGLTPPAAGTAINSIVATSTLLYAGAANGRVYLSTDHGSSWSNIVTPAPGFAVNGLFISADNYIYIASSNGRAFICALNGTQCVQTKAPAVGFALNGVFAHANHLYTASANGFVYHSVNQGQTWQTINGQPDSSAVKSVYVAGNTIYIGTQNEYVYTSTSLTGGGSWTPYAQTVYSLFVNPKGTIIDAGTQGGFVFSLNSGNQLGFVSYSPVNSVFHLP